jgi:hypothetical protein
MPVTLGLKERTKEEEARELSQESFILKKYAVGIRSFLITSKSVFISSKEASISPTRTQQKAFCIFT